jgi:thermostable 8-oxoguanine DNA glycosylase
MLVVFPSPGVEKAIVKYLTTKREYKIPESNRIDDYRIDKELPTRNRMYFELALCTLYAETGVFVDWSTLKEEA